MEIVKNLKQNLKQNEKLEQKEELEQKLIKNREDLKEYNITRTFEIMNSYTWLP